MSGSAIPAHRYTGRRNGKRRLSAEAVSAMIESAIAAEDVLRFSYPSSTDGSPVERTFSPWLLERDGEIVKGWDHNREGIRRYVISRIGDTIQVDLAEEWARPL